MLEIWSNRMGAPLTNLFKLSLPKGWRALYTELSQAPEGARAVLVVEIVDHKEYERLLGY